MLPASARPTRSRSFDPPAGYDGPGPNPLLQNHLADGLPPADALPRLRRVHRARSPSPSPPWPPAGSARAGWSRRGAGRCSRGASSPSASSSARGGATRCSGWGGYWAWDPVENASLLPWLTGTAYPALGDGPGAAGDAPRLEPVAAVRDVRADDPRHVPHPLRRARVGARLHRVGHRPAASSASSRSWCWSTLTLIGWRGDRLRSPGRIDSPLSREAGFLANNVLFAAVRLRRAARHGVPARSSRRSTTSALGRPAVLRRVRSGRSACSSCSSWRWRPVLPWRKTTASTLAPAAALAGVGRARSSVVVAVLAGARGFTPLLAFGLGGFAAGSAVRQLVLATRRQGWRGLVGRANGGMIVHLGVVLIAVGIAASGTYSTQREVRLDGGRVGGRRPGTPCAISAASSEELAEKTVVAARVRDRRRPGVRARAQHLQRQRRAVGGPADQTPSVRTGRSTTSTSSCCRRRRATRSACGSSSSPWSPGCGRAGCSWPIGTVLAAWPGRRRRPTDPVSAPVGGPAPRSGSPEPVGVG